MEQWLWVLGPFVGAVLLWRLVRPRWEEWEGRQRPEDERAVLNRMAATEARRRRQRAKQGRAESDPDW